MATARVLRVERGGEAGISAMISAYFDRLAIMLFGRVARKLVSVFELEKSMREAGMEIHPTTFAARLLMYTFLSGILMSIVTIVAASLGAPTILVVTLVLLIFLIPLMVFGIGLSIPSMRKGSREKGVDSELPYFAAYMTTMAYAGTAPESIFEKVAKLKVFRAIREEAMRIMRDVRVFGQDPLSAIERNAYFHPSKLYRDLLLGYTTTVRTGGDVLHYLEVKTIDIFRQFGENLKGIAERIGLVIEAYIAVAVIGTLSFYIFFVVSGILPGGAGFGGFAGYSGMILYSFLMMPALTLVMLLVADAAQPKTPIYHREPYAWLLISIPLGLTILVAGLLSTGSYEVLIGGRVNPQQLYTLLAVFTLSLSVISLIPAAIHMRIYRKLRGLHHSLATFLRDLAEVRKTGLSPEKTIIMLSERDYGGLTAIIRRAAGALALGLPIEQAVREAVRGIKDWFLLVNLRILVDAIDVGGGTPQILDTMARYAAELATLMDELKRRLRSYAFMPYFGSLLITVASLMTIVALVQAVTQTGLEAQAPGATAIALMGPQEIMRLVAITLIGSIFNAWLMGLVVGKVQTMMTSAGFIHSTILAIITAVIGLATVTATAPALFASG